jgi:hypothetical protein
MAGWIRAGRTFMFPRYNIVLEGLDRAGKTTLTKAVNDSAYVKLKLGPPVSKQHTFYAYTGYFMRLHGYIPTSIPFWYDRGHISELLYGKLYRPEWHTDGLIRRWIGQQEQHISTLASLSVDFRRTVIVYIIGDTSIMEEDTDRPTADQEAEGLGYLRLLNASSLPVIALRSARNGQWRNPLDMIDELECKLKGLNA